MALFEEPSEPFISSYLKGYTTPGPLERRKSKHAKVSNTCLFESYFFMKF